MRIHPVFPSKLGVLLALVCLALQPGVARALPGSPEGMMGTIPGTNMTKDEFRARAHAQLAAVALNAHAYHLATGDFPATYYDLYNSRAWNLDISNIFTGRTVDSIEFTPTKDDMTDAAVIGLPVFELPAAAPAAPPPGQGKLGQGGIPEVQLDFGELTKSALEQAGQGATKRVNPMKIDPKTPGAIYYYTRNGLLQLVMFAPDGTTYVEHVNEVPNRGWLDELSINATGGRSFPDDMYANQVLYYAERMLPRHYNLVRFMGNAKPLTEPELRAAGATLRIQLAAELGVTMFNPYRQRAIKVVATPTEGELLAAEGAPALPLKIVLKSGEAATFAALSRGLSEPQPAGRPVKQPGKGTPPANPDKPRPTPPMGGRG